MQYEVYEKKNHPYLKRVLHEAVFWRRGEDKPSLEEGLSYDYTRHVLLNFGKRVGDLAVIASDQGKSIGGAFIRFWSDEENLRGYIKPEIPVLVIAVDPTYRRQGIASALIHHLKKLSVEMNIHQISLCVTKDNHALILYKKVDFKIVEDIGDSYLMLWNHKS